MTRHRVSHRLRTMVAICGLLATVQPIHAQHGDGPPPASHAEVLALESRVDQLDRDLDEKTDDLASAGALAFLFGAFCALWAQNTGRNPWLWFFLGLFFSVITVLFLLRKNRESRPPPFDLEQYRVQ